MAINFTDFSTFEKWVEIQRRFSPKESLKKMDYYCSLFDHPERKFHSIHITGTNGKGSCVAYLRSIFKERGLKVATYTSPHVICFNERIAYDMKFISNEDMLFFGNQICSKYDQIIADGYETPSFFEFITLLAFLYFASIPELDIAIIEVGMGGRLDATNVITPYLSIISNVAMDHMKQLGDTVEKIATEKLGIVKPNTYCVCGSKISSVQQLVKETCEKRNCGYFITKPEEVTIEEMDLTHTIFSNSEYAHLEIPLAGFHQIENTLVVLETIRYWNQLMEKKSNLIISEEILRRGLKNTTWPGRFEIISQNPLIVIDGGHNIDGITRLCEFIQTLDYSFKRCIISISHDKELETMMKLIDQTFDEVVCTAYTYERSAAPDVLFQLSHNPNKKIASLEEAITLAQTNKVPFTIFIGSLYLVSDIRQKILKQQ
jgi:dihydrofolate synthase/folylpolyglutamate synthase